MSTQWFVKRHPNANKKKPYKNLACLSGPPGFVRVGFVLHQISNASQVAPRVSKGNATGIVRVGLVALNASFGGTQGFISPGAS